MRLHQPERTRKKRSLMAGQGNADRRIRGDGQSMSIPRMADLTGYRPKSCQYIAGDDGVMCGEAGFPYCPDHSSVCHAKRDEDVA